MSIGARRDLASAVEAVLVHGGAMTLQSPDMLMAGLADLMDAESVELDIMRKHADAAMLAPFGEAAERKDASLLAQAQASACNRLANERDVPSASAQKVAAGLATGVAAWRGIAWEASGNKGRTERGGFTKGAGTGASRKPGETSSPGFTNEGVYRDPKKLLFAGVAVLLVVVVGVVGWLFLRHRGSAEEGYWVLMEQEKTDTNGCVIYHYEVSYDNQGNVLTSNTTDEDRSSLYWRGEDVAKNTWSRSYDGYDSYGYPSSGDYESIEYLADGTIGWGSRDRYTYEFTIDDDGRPMKLTKQNECDQYNTSAKAWESFYTETTDYTFTFARDGAMVVDGHKELEYSSGGQYTETLHYEYNADGRQTRYKTERYDEDGLVWSNDFVTTYKNRFDGTLQASTETYTYWSDYSGTSVTTTESSYDEHENLLKSVTVDDEGKRDTSEYQYRYNKQDQIVEETATIVEDGKTTTTTYQYEYGEDGKLRTLHDLTSGATTVYTRHRIDNPSDRLQLPVSIDFFLS